MALYSFGHQANPVHALDSDGDRSRRDAQLDLDDPQGTALYDAIIQASAELCDAPTLTKVLVVLTDGDNTTKTTLAAAIKAAKTAGVTVDAIALGTDHDPGALRASPARRAATSSPRIARPPASAPSTAQIA